MARISIRRRLRTNTLTVLAVLTAFFAFQQWISMRLDETFKHVQSHEVEPEYDLRSIVATAGQIRLAMLQVLLAHADSEFARFDLREQQAEIEAAWKAFKGKHRLYLGDPRERLLIALIDDELPTLRSIFERMATAYTIYDPVELTRIARQDWAGLDSTILLHLRELSELQRQHALLAYQDLVTEFRHASVELGGLLAAGFLFIALFSSVLNNHINRKIQGIEDGLARATTGDLAATIPEDADTEFGRIARAINYTLGLLRRERDELAALGRKTEAILSSITDGIYGVNAEGRIIFINDGACRMLGYAAAELTGRLSHPTFHHHRADGSPYPTEDCPFINARRGGATIHGDDEHLIRKDGSSFPIEYTCTPLRGSTHDDAAIVVFRDITERRAREDRLHAAYRELHRSTEELKTTQSQLLQSEKMASIGQLAAGVAHEINNPVGFVNSNLGSLRNYLTQLFEVIDAYGELEASAGIDEAARERLEEIKDQADLAYLRQDIVDLLRESQDGLGRIKRIVADLKDFSHVGEVEWQEADLNAGIESTLNVVWNELKYKAEVIRDFGQLPPVRCLAAQLNQVIMNLLVNAAQAIEEHGTITIRTRSEGDQVLIEVADTGKGIPPEIQQRIFEPFFTTKPVGKGTGLGLSIAWDIIGKHHGTIGLDSTPGEGTTFTIRVPVRGAPDAEDAGEAADPPDAEESARGPRGSP